MLKDTQGTRQSVPTKSFLFDPQRLAYAHNQFYTPTEWVPAAHLVCPILVRCEVQAKQHARSLKEVARAEKQRADRAASREAGILRPRVKPVRYAEPVPHPVPSPSVGGLLVWPQRQLEAALAQLGHKPSKRAKKSAAPADELLLDNKEITPPPSEVEERHAKGRLKSLATADFLDARAGLEGNIQNPLFKAAHNIRNCNTVALLQHVNTDTNYKVGSALCKNRLCPICQRALAGKRRANFLDWFELNRVKLRRYFFYHMVLTVRHSAADGVRAGYYTPDLLAYCAQLRGTHDSLSGAQQRRLSAIWNEFVEGGSYGIEVKGGRDGSPHIHVHMFLIGRKRLYNKAKPSTFLLHVRKRWRAITGDSDGVFLLPIYYKGEDGEPVYCEKGSNANVERAATECMKYTIKADASALGSYSNNFLVSLLTMRNRYYARFGCLSGNDKRSAQFEHLDMLSADYVDLERLTRLELARLFDPETGELVDKEDTRLVVAPYSLLQAQPSVVRLHDEAGAVVEPPRGQALMGGENFYKLLPGTPGQLQWFQYEERDRAAVLLSRYISGDYNPRSEPEAVQLARKGAQPRKRQAPAVVVHAPLSFCRPARLASGRWYARVGAPKHSACRMSAHGWGGLPVRAHSHQRLGARWFPSLDSLFNPC